jgi:3-oxoacyl-[acyl-carrier-protein] synthase II
MPDRLEPIVITGVGLVTALGHDAASTWAGLLAGRSGVSDVEPRPGGPEGCRVWARVPALEPPSDLRVPKHAKYMGRSACCALVALKEAVRSAGLDPRGVDPYRVAVLAGSGETGLSYEEFFPALDHAWRDGGARDLGLLGARAARLVDPYFSLRSLANGPAALAAIELGVHGPSRNYVQGVTASAHALAAACEQLCDGLVDVAIVIGCDALTGSAPARAHHEAGLVSHQAPPRAGVPFDRDRDGYVLGEAGAALVLERAPDARRRGAPALAEVAGVGFATVARGPSREGSVDALRTAARAALAGRSERPAVSIAHGDATRDGGARELAGLTAVLGAGVPITAATGATGFVGAATPVLQVVLATCVLRTGDVPAVAGLVDPEPTPLDLVQGPRRLPVPRGLLVIGLTHGFSGEHAAIAIGEVPPC